MLVLKDAEVVAAGHTRNVYRHPDDPSLLVKVIRPSAIEERYGRGAPWYKYKRRRYRHLIAYLREVREHIAVHAIGDRHPPFLQKIVGFVDTDLGLGLVVEAVKARDGSFAPTLADLARQGRVDDAILQKLDVFLNEMIRSPVIVADLNLYNLVYGYTPEGGDHFVLIDGLGHKNIIPLELMSSFINRWSKARKADRLRAQCKARMAAVEQATLPERAVSTASHTQ